MMNSLENYIVAADLSVRELMVVIGKNARGIALVTDSKRKLITTLTDGDVRRGLLDGVRMDSLVCLLMENKLERVSHPAITVNPEKSDEECLKLLDQEQIRQLPVLSEDGCVVDLVFRDDLLGGKALRLSYVSEEVDESPVKDLNVYGVIMAGGFGTRLQPLTDNIPKPMLPVNGRPLLEIIIERFERAGIKKLFLSTYYKKDVIEEYFRDGRDFNVSIDYLHEDSPIGTAGALGLIEKIDRPIVMTNGDLLTKVCWNALIDFHYDQEAVLTVGVRQYDIKVPFGVMNTDGATVISVDEKPVLDFLVNAGVYVLSPQAHAMIPKGQRYDMTDLIEDVINAGGKVVAFPIVEYWLDIGQMADYKQAQEDHA